MIEKKTSIWATICSILFLATLCHAKSVYVVSNLNSGQIQTYRIGDNQLTLQRTTSFSNPGGTIGIAVGESLVGTFLFVTYEGESFIRVINAKTMTIIDDVSLPHAANLSGIVYDSQRTKVYAVDRFSNRLYSYSWDARNLLLQPDFDEPYYHELEEIEVGNYTGAAGIALDSVNNYLYVSDNTSSIKYYDVADWSYLGTVQTSLNEILGIAIDPQAQILYFGSMEDYGQQWHYLSSYDLTASDPNDAQLDESVGASICGITCDPETGYVFTTMFGSGGETTYPDAAAQDSIQMFSPYDMNSLPDPNLTLVWDSPDVGNPTGIAFSNEDYKPSGIVITKVDDAATCVEPEDVVTYTIVVKSKSGEQTGVVVTDILPYEADFISADPNTGVYYPQDHVYIWDDITLPDPNSQGDPNVYLSLTVQVNYGAEPESQMVNTVIAESETAYDKAECSTDICCWGGNIIFVDKNAVWSRICFGGLIGVSGYNSGTSWDDAYRDLQDAIERARNGCGSEIWVADGTYSPGTDYDKTFDVPAGVSIYGGFKGDETSREDRNVALYETVLSGSRVNQTVVKLGNGCVLDGVTVTGSSSAAESRGISVVNANAEIINCVIRDNEQRGIRCDNGSLTVRSCDIFNNGTYGIWQQGSGQNLAVFNSKIHDNQFDGIYTALSTATILNSLIYQNGMGSTPQNSYYGINLVNPYTTPTIRNNTIVQNVNEGIRRSGGSVPTVKNCILYFNNDEGTQLVGMNPTQTTYCCISDCNDVNGQHDINDLPGFVYAEPDGWPITGNYHLVWDSPCVDNGDSASYTSETDIDGDERVAGDKVDIGADEVSCTDTSHVRDWTYDGVINFDEFSIFSRAFMSWDPNSPLCDPNHPDYVSDPNAPGYISETDKANWNPLCDFNDDTTVDLADFIQFCDNYLWIACWRTDLLELVEQQSQQMMSMPSGEPESMMILPMTEVSSQEQTAIEELPVIEEKSIEEQILDLQDCIEFLEELWLNEPDIQQEIDSAAWQEFMNSVQYCPVIS